MSDWGKVVLYYDYEKENTGYAETPHVRGIVSKSYKYPGIEGMILHAFGGLQYFLRTLNSKYTSYDMSTMDSSYDYKNLCGAFDTFFDFGIVNYGPNAAERVIEKGLTSADDIHAELFNCEGTYGWLYFNYTGNPKDGYTCKYAYNLKGKLYSLEEAFRLPYCRQYDLDSEDIKSVEQAIEYIQNKSELMTGEEHHKLEENAVKLFLNEN